GTHLLIVLPGRSETTGGAPAMFVGQTPRDLTIADAKALETSATIRYVAPVVIGSVAVSFRERDREVAVLGSTAELLDIRHWEMAQGHFLPPGDPERAQAVCVIGAKVRRELFGNEPVLGQWLRAGERRYRVIGVLASEGRAIGLDVEDLVIVPVASAQALFNTPSLFRILVEARSREAIEPARAYIRRTITERHQGEEDITVITQDAVLATFDRILRALTLTLGGIAAISLLVAGILIMNVMLVAVSQRTTEVGLLKAVGAAPGQIVTVFLAEAVVLSVTGAAIGVGAGVLIDWGIGRIYPALPIVAPWWSVGLAFVLATLAGVGFGVLPARRAARLDPVQALARR
ncbi:MAG: FtsX-like permease family protein, partial [Gammaproteobacteria bacterium]|nr:FtsX-like permease family protein [Gammaproteobacteria bacterium]NIV76450.1 FtsX-like permease family protein [Gammaproteobacteria bacterium]